MSVPFKSVKLLRADKVQSLTVHQIKKDDKKLLYLKAKLQQVTTEIPNSYRAILDTLKSLNPGSGFAFNLSFNGAKSTFNELNSTSYKEFASAVMTVDYLKTLKSDFSSYLETVVTPKILEAHSTVNSMQGDISTKIRELSIAVAESELDLSEVLDTNQHRLLQLQQIEADMQLIIDMMKQFQEVTALSAAALSNIEAGVVHASADVAEANTSISDAISNARLPSGRIALIVGLSGAVVATIGAVVGVFTAGAAVLVIVAPASIAFVLLELHNNNILDLRNFEEY